MKTNKILWFIFILTLLGTAFAAGYSIKNEKQPDYSTSDSIALDSIKTRIDTIKVKVVEWRTKVKTIYDTDTVIYMGTDTACIEIIERKNKLIAGQGTIIDLLDEECRSYSDMNLIEIKRNEQLFDSVSSLHVLYTDSLTAQRKTSDKSIKKEKTKTFLYKVTTTVACVLAIYSTVK